MGKPRVCTSIFASSREELEEKLSLAFEAGSDLAEIRIDHLSDRHLVEAGPNLKKHCRRSIIACRSVGEGGKFLGREQDRFRILVEWSRIKPSFIDIELDFIESNPVWLDELKACGASLIVSWHDFTSTPPKPKLLEVFNRAQSLGSYAKVVTKARSLEDNTKVLSLYKLAKRDRLIAFCMGSKGEVSRILCPLLGSPFTYASLDGSPRALGQIPIGVLKGFYDAIGTRGPMSRRLPDRGADRTAQLG